MRISSRAALCLVGVFVCLAPVALADHHDFADRAEAWENAFAAGDVAGVAALYTEDARLMPPNAAMIQGREGVASTFDGMKGLEIDLDATETATSGDIGYRVGTYVLRTADGSPVDNGKFIETWRKVGGQWMITNDIWNSDLPAASDDNDDDEDDEDDEGDEGHGHDG